MLRRDMLLRLHFRRISHPTRYHRRQLSYQCLRHTVSGPRQSPSKPLETPSSPHIHLRQANINTFFTLSQFNLAMSTGGEPNASSSHIAETEETLELLEYNLQRDAQTQIRADELLQNIQDIRDRVQLAVRNVDEVGMQRWVPAGSEEPFLIAVSKTKPASDILALHSRAGQVHFGENYIQELIKKASLLPPTINWHYIGTLQSSAISKLAKIKNLYSVHSVDSAKKALLLNKHRPEGYPLVKVFIQVNTSGEDSKSGLEPDGEEVFDACKVVIEECDKLELEGVMTIGMLARSLAVKQGEENGDFRILREVAEKIEKRLGLGDEKEGKGEFLKLSMGMSEDFEGAIKMGASCVRVGSSIFGKRVKKGEVA